MENKNLLNNNSINFNVRKSSLIHNENKLLQQEVIEFVRKVEDYYQFTGEFEVYTIYNDVKNDKIIQVYALVHTDHDISYEDKDKCEEIFEKESRILHEELLKSKIDLDYFFIMPYFTVWNENRTEKSCYLGNITTVGRNNCQNIDEKSS